MKVLIHAASAHMGGARTYLENVLRWWPGVAPGVRATVVVPPGSGKRFQPLAVGGVELLEFPGRRTGGPGRLWFDQVSIRRLARDRGEDVLFSSTGFGTFWSPIPQVLLVRNPVYFDRGFLARYQELGRAPWRTLLRRRYSQASIHHADLVLFPSHAMRRMVGDHVDLGRVETAVLHYGVDTSAFSSNGASLAPLTEIRRRKEAGQRVLLNVSTYAVHKNLELLVETLARLESLGHEVVLLTTTSRDRTRDKREYDALQSRIAATGLRERWVELGYVPYGTLGALYGVADVFVFPSFTESFGHSMVEAMAAGLPVVAADAPVNREICGDAGVYFGTFDAGSCAEAIAGVLEDQAYRDALRAASSTRARDFSWEAYTRGLVDVFRRVVER